MKVLSLRGGLFGLFGCIFPDLRRFLGGDWGVIRHFPYVLLPRSYTEV